MVPDPLVPAHLATKDRRQVGAVREQVLTLGDHAHAHRIVGQGDVPEPASVRQKGDRRRALVPARVAQGAAKIGPDGDLVQHGIALPPVIGLDGPCASPAGIDGQRCLHRVAGAVAAHRLDPAHLAVIAQQSNGLGRLADLSPFLAGVVQQHLVELAAEHLPRHGRLVVHVLEEVKGGRDLALRAGKLHGILPRKGRSVHAFNHTDPLQGEVAERQQRLADVVAGEPLFFEHQHPAAVLGQDRRGRGSGRPPADDDYVVVLIFGHLNFAACRGALASPCEHLREFLSYWHVSSLTSRSAPSRPPAAGSR